MVNVDIDIDLYGDIKDIVRKNKLTYPSIKFFVNKVLFDKSLEIKENFKRKKRHTKKR